MQPCRRGLCPAARSLLHSPFQPLSEGPPQQQATFVSSSRRSEARRPFGATRAGLPRHCRPPLQPLQLHPAPRRAIVARAPIVPGTQHCLKHSEEASQHNIPSPSKYAARRGIVWMCLRYACSQACFLLASNSDVQMLRSYIKGQVARPMPFSFQTPFLSFSFLSCVPCDVFFELSLLKT